MLGTGMCFILLLEVSAGHWLEACGGGGQIHPAPHLLAEA